MARLILLGESCHAQDKLMPWLDVASIDNIENGVEFILKRPPSNQEKQEIRKILSPIKGDFALRDDDVRDFKLFIADMDSTLMNMETLDVMAEILGKGDKVANITAKAMQGEMDFTQSLNLRLRTLEGAKAAPLFAATNQRISQCINPGVERLLTKFKQMHMHCVIVSGGFTFAAEFLAKKLGFDECYANRLEIDETGCLTGRVLGEVVDRAFKGRILQEKTSLLQISQGQTIAIGDGSNDLDMLEQAGLGIGYCAKPIVKERVNAQINSRNMHAIIHYIAPSSIILPLRV